MERMYDIIWHETLDSTNNEALRCAGSLDNLSVIAARTQTAGRGQKSNRWTAAPGENLTFSIFLRFRTGASANAADCPVLKAAEQFVISETAAISLCRLLAAHGIRARIKWPNDIYAGDRKISGMLTENSLRGNLLRTSVVGIGLNVNQKHFPSDIPNPVSMSLLTGKEYRLGDLLDEFMKIFSCCMETAVAGRNFQDLKSEYERLMYRIGEPAMFADITDRPAYLPANTVTGMKPDGKESGSRFFPGCIEGITDSGLLRMKLGDGTVREFGFKEISFVV